MIDVNDPTSYGSDIIRAKEERALGDDDDFFMPGDEDDDHNKQKAASAASKPKEKSKQRNTLTILTEDREWGDRGKG